MKGDKIISVDDIPTASRLVDQLGDLLAYRKNVMADSQSFEVRFRDGLLNFPDREAIHRHYVWTILAGRIREVEKQLRDLGVWVVPADLDPPDPRT